VHKYTFSGNLAGVIALGTSSALRRHQGSCPKGDLLEEQMRNLWRNYNLSIVLLVLFLASWIGQAIFQWFEMANEAQAHGQASTLAEFVPAFFSATFENWQSEFLQLFTMVVLTAFLIHRGSHESKDQDEKVDQTLARIERRLERIEQAQGSPAGANGAATDGRHLAGAGSTTRS
jgi:hypothetical protein